MIFGSCIKEALFFAESHMILTGFLEKEKTNIKNEFEFKASEVKLFDTFYARAHALHIKHK